MINVDVINAYINNKVNILHVYSTGEMELDYADLLSFDRIMADALQNNPDQFIEIFRGALYNRFLNLDLEPKDIDIKVVGVIPHIMIKDIGSKFETKLISFYGLIVRRSEIEPVVEINKYLCESCNQITLITAQQKPPSKCQYCNSKKIKLIDSVKKDVQYLDVQEPIERTEPGVPAPKIKCILTEKFINTVLPGEVIEITGVLRLIQNQNKKPPGLSKIIDVKGIRRTQIDFDSINLTDKDKEEILEFSKSPEALETFSELVFPDIYGYDDIKKAIILQLIGANRKITKAGTILRSNIHILLIGDPGIAKSRILQQVASISPKAIYVSGKSASGVGLTATVEKDEYVGWTLKAGAVVLASGGIVTIDEFDKLDDDEKSALHEVMESGTVSIAKAGIVAKLIANTTILAAANPKHGRFSLRKRIVDQFNIPPTLLSRFDLIFPIIDQIDENKDEKLAGAILSMHKDFGKSRQRSDFVRKYISYARKQSPLLTDEASSIIKSFYIEMRKLGAKSGNVAITPRYLEGAIRLAEAHAKFRLSEKVEKIDVDVSIDLIKKMIDNVLKDPETGEISVDTITSGITSSKRGKIEMIYDIIRDLYHEDGRYAYKKKIKERALQQGIDERELEKIIKELIATGDIYESKTGEDGAYSPTQP